MLTLFEHFPSLICEAGTINLVKCGTGLIYEIFQFFRCCKIRSWIMSIRNPAAVVLTYRTLLAITASRSTWFLDILESFVKAIKLCCPQYLSHSKSVTCSPRSPKASLMVTTSRPASHNPLINEGLSKHRSMKKRALGMITLPWGGRPSNLWLCRPEYRSFPLKLRNCPRPGHSPQCHGYEFHSVPTSVHRN